MDRIESLERRFNRLQRCEIEDMFDVELNIYGYDYAVEEYGKEYVESPDERRKREWMRF